MKRTLTILALALFTTGASAQALNGQASAGSVSDSGASASTGAITFEAGKQRGSVSTTAPVYIAPAMFGGANNCGQSNTFGVGGTGLGFGGAVAGESDPCNAREDTAIAYKLGHRDVAEMRFFCFGESENRMAWEATGKTCPATATATGIEQRAADQRRNGTSVFNTNG